MKLINHLTVIKGLKKKQYVIIKVIDLSLFRVIIPYTKQKSNFLQFRYGYSIINKKQN